MDQAQTGRPENGAVTPHQPPSVLFKHEDADGDTLRVLSQRKIAGITWPGSIEITESLQATDHGQEQYVVATFTPTSPEKVAALISAILRSSGHQITTRGGAYVEWTVS